MQATAMNMSNMVGIGPFITIPALMSALGGPQAMLGWLVALIVAMADGLVWSELGAALPGSGGSYSFLRDGLGRLRWGRLMAFLFIFQFLFSGPLEIASGFIGFSQYLHYLWKSASDRAVLLGGAVAGVLCIILLYRPIHNIGRIMVGLWIGMLITIAAVIVTGAIHFDPKVAFDFPPNAWSFTPDFWFGLGAASAVGMYDYLGYYNICHLGDEVRNPGRVIPRSVLISLVVVALIYVGINFSIIGTISWRSFVPAPVTGPPPPIVSMLMEKAWGKDVAAVFTVLVLWTALASCVALLLGYSRIPYAAARDGNFFRVFARLHPTGAFPHISLVVIGLLAVAFTFLPLLDVINALLTTRIAVQFIGQIVALIVLRRTRPDMVRPFRMWLYPLPAFVALVGWIYLLVAVFKPTPETTLEMTLKLLTYAASVIIAGVICFLVLAKIAGKWPFERSEK